MQRSCARLVGRSLSQTQARARALAFYSSKSGGGGGGGENDKIVASVIFERLPVVISKIDPFVYAFQQFSWRQQYWREYPEKLLKKSDVRGKGDLPNGLCTSSSDH